MPLDHHASPEGNANRGGGGEASGQFDDDLRTSVEHRIRQRIADFDAPALLELLGYLGYDIADIAFSGHPSKGTEPSVFAAVRFAESDPAPAPDPEPDPEPGPASESTPAFDSGPAPTVPVSVVANVGLSSCRSPLPSYLQRLLGEFIPGEVFAALVDMLDHTLLRDRFTADCPEQMFADWEQGKRDLVDLANLASPSGLDWLFRHTFPELDVVVQRIPSERRVLSKAARIGHGALGQCAFGHFASVPVQDVEVALLCRDADTRAGEPWIHAAPARLRQHIFPFLRQVRMQLTVALILLTQTTYADLEGDSYVAYDPLRGGPDRPQRIVLFSGSMPHQPQSP